MKNRNFKNIALIFAIGITLVLGGCSGNDGQSEGTGSGTVEVPNNSAVVSDDVSTVAVGDTAETNTETTASEEETNTSDEEPVIPESWHRTLV